MESREVLVLELMWEYNCTMEEAAEHRGTKRYFINRHNRLLPEDGVEEQNKFIRIQ